MMDPYLQQTSKRPEKVKAGERFEDFDIHGLARSRYNPQREVCPCCGFDARQAAHESPADRFAERVRAVLFDVGKPMQYHIEDLDPEAAQQAYQERAAEREQWRQEMREKKGRR